MATFHAHTTQSQLNNQIKNAHSSMKTAASSSSSAAAAGIGIGIGTGIGTQLPEKYRQHLQQFQLKHQHQHQQHQQHQQKLSQQSQIQHQNNSEFRSRSTQFQSELSEKSIQSPSIQQQQQQQTQPTTNPINAKSMTTVPRTNDDSQLIDLCYGARITIQSGSVDDALGRGATGQYVHIDDANGKLGITYTPVEYVITNSKFMHDKSAVRFQDIVHLECRGRYLSGEEKGDAGGFRTKTEVRTRWQIVPAMDEVVRANAQHSVRGNVKIVDTIALKSVYQTYLTVDSGQTVHAAASSISPDTTFIIAKSGIPIEPEWVRYRMPEHAICIVDHDISSVTEQQQPLHSLPLDVQERILLEHALAAMIGLESNYIRQSNMIAATDNPFAQPVDAFITTAQKRNSAFDDLKLTVSPQIRDKGLREQLLRIIPIGEHYHRIRHFADVHIRYGYGCVNHALASAIEDLIKDYLIFIVQLEHQQASNALTLNKLFFFMQPALKTLSQLNTICMHLRGLSGGALLNALHKAIEFEGEIGTRQLYMKLMSAASVPYFSILRQWLLHGVILDPYDEFQIKAREDLRKEAVQSDFHAAYWDERYTVREEKLPSFLELYSDKILQTGKYLNVIRECGRTIKSPFEDLELAYSANEREYVELIEKAYKFASRELLTLLIHENDLIGRLRSIKRYFLLCQGDFYTHFMDMAESELQKPLAEINTNKLQNLFELSVRTTSVASDPYHEDIGCHFVAHSLMQQLKMARADTGTGEKSSVGSMAMQHHMLTGIDTLTLKYRVRWPLTVILSKKTLSKYNMLFRHLFARKYVERQLESTWRFQQLSKELDLRGSFSSSYSLRHRMLYFFQNYLYFMMIEVIEPNFLQLEHNLQSVTTVDDVLKEHNGFLDRSLRECLLTNQKLLETLNRMSANSLDFANQIDRLSIRLDREQSRSAFNEELLQTNNRAIARRKARVQLETQHMIALSRREDYVQLIQSGTKSFETLLLEFLAYLRAKSSQNFDSHLGNLLMRLNSNGFYTDALAALPPQRANLLASPSKDINITALAASP